LKEKECITFPYSLIYKTLDCAKIIDYSKNERIEMYKKAQFVLESKLRNERAKGIIKASKMEFEIKEIQESKNQKVIIKAQEMLVLKFFEICKQQFQEMGIKFEENFTEESKLQFNLNYEAKNK
jgi:Flp pilus assembly secretin CpaC